MIPQRFLRLTVSMATPTRYQTTQQCLKTQYRWWRLHCHRSSSFSLCWNKTINVHDRHIAGCCRSTPKGHFANLSNAGACSAVYPVLGTPPGEGKLSDKKADHLPEVLMEAPTRIHSGRTRCPSTASDTRSCTMLYQCRNSVEIHRKLSGLYVLGRHFSNCALPKGRFSTGNTYFSVGKAIDSREETESRELGCSKNENTASEIATSVIAVCSKSDKMVLSIPPKKVEAFVQFLLDEGFQEELVEQFLEHRPECLKSNNKLMAVLPYLTAYGFEVKQVFHILMTLPDLSLLQESRVEDLSVSLRALGVDGDALFHLIADVPGLLSLDGRAVATRTSELKAYFTKADVARLVLQTPNVLLCDWKDIEDKFHYVHDVMCVSQRQIVYSRLFSYPLFHVKCRHMFLVRAGFFVGNKKVREINPKLQDIIDTSDVQFAKKYGEMHVDEYRTFCKLFEKDTHDQFGDVEILY